VVRIRRQAELVQGPLDAVLLWRDSSSGQQHPVGTGLDEALPAVGRLDALVQRHMPTLVRQEPVRVRMVFPRLEPPGINHDDALGRAAEVLPATTPASLSAVKLSASGW
jgi:hypothetical protein